MIFDKNEKEENNTESYEIVKRFNYEDFNELLRLLTNDNFFNGDKTRFFKDYEFLIRVIGLLNEKEFSQFIIYMNQKDISILKVLINGYFFYDLTNKVKLEKIVLESISKIIRFFFNKNIFYFIYAKMSQYFRNHDYKEENMLIKFKQIFEIWKLLYNIENFPQNNQVNSNNIYFYKINNKNIEINFKEQKLLIDAFEHILSSKEKKIFFQKGDKSNNELIISINFEFSSILKVNNYIKDFSFLKIYNKKGEVVEFKYEDVFKENMFNCIINRLDFHLSGYKYSTIFINYKEIERKKQSFDFNKISKLEILNNFIGVISSITIEKYFYDDSKKVSIKKYLFKYVIQRNSVDNNKIEIKQDNSQNFQKLNKDDKNLIDFIDNKGEIFSENYIDFMKERAYRRTEMDLYDIRNMGGLESLIPIFKIIKYIINNLENSNFIFKVNNKKYYLNQSLIYIKDVITIIIKTSLLSEINNQNFYKIIVPLIGALSEILNALNSSNLINENEINEFFNDEIFFILYMFTLNSTLPKNVKKAFKNLFRINFQNLNFTADSIILNLDNIKYMDFYFSLLFNFVEFTLFYISPNKIPNKLIEQLNNIYLFQKQNQNNDAIQAIEPFIKFVKIFCLNEEEKIFIHDIFCKCQHLLITNKFYLMLIINMIKTYLNKKEIIEFDTKNEDPNSNDLNKASNDNSKKNNENIFNSIEKIILISAFGDIKELETSLFLFNSDKHQIVIDNFKYYFRHLDFLKNFFPFLLKDLYNSESELIMNELIDYHGQYHRLMKELFIFNRLWSDQKLFFGNSLESKRAKLKCKTINYYTKNFQRPIIYPALDYKSRYPEFSKFQINKDLFNNPENKDDYNFDFESRELDNFINDYYQEILFKMKNNQNTNIKFYENTCLIKQKYHVKGDLIIINNKIIYFFSYPNSLQNTISCNRIIETNKKCLCYGTLFKSLKKEEFIKIKIDIDNIRLIMKRIYYYRESAFEIFTESKSYYFNFQDENNLQKLFSLFIIPFRNLYFPININNDIKGFIKMNPSIIKSLNYDTLLEKPNYLLEFILENSSKKEKCEMCVFDLIIVINLISNRSYNDLAQYPVFPLLFFFDNTDNKIKDRDFNEQIGFQRITKDSELRSDLFESLYKDRNSDNDRVSRIEIPFYFGTHYSNNVFTSNFLIRLIPYALYAIELQGDGFDNPNRLFYSIENTFNNISKQKSDLRELIPEFFYLPEMFMNINDFNFKKNDKDIPIDDVLISNDLIEYFLNLNNNLNQKEKKAKYTSKETIYFYFVIIMKNYLESLRDKLISWINIIFGTQQRYNKKNEQYFRTESYIDIDEETRNTYLNDEIIMESVEFGLAPYPIISESKILNNIKKDNYEKFDEDLKKLFKKRKSSRSFKINEKNNKKTDLDKMIKVDIDMIYKDFQIKNKIIDYCGEYWDYSFTKDYNKLIIKKFEKKIDVEEIIDTIEIIDHSDQILDCHYNPRLNMFATTSYDGYICIYILPNKLVSTIKHPNDYYYEQILLSANPFPTIIAFDKKENQLTSYSLSGIKIKTISAKGEGEKIGSDFKIKPLFNEYGGNFKDRIIFYSNSGYFKIVNVPFFIDECDK